MKNAFLFLFIGIIVFSIFHRYTSFDSSKLYQEISESKKEIPQEILSILNQKFTFLSKGAQMYAFSSEDGEYVLKLFQAKHNKPRKFYKRVKCIFSSSEQKILSQKKWKIKFHETCQRNILAFDFLRNETGLIYLHFEKSSIPVLVTICKKKRSTLDLSKLPFLIQKKAELVPEYFQKLALKKDHQEFSIAKNALKDFFVKRAQKGITDPRQVLHLNYGFADGKFIQIDVGKIEPLQKPIEEEIKIIHARIDFWFAKRFPNYIIK